MLTLAFIALTTCTIAQGDAAIEADVVLQGATLYDGSDQPGKVGDIAIKNDRIVAIGKFKVKGKPRVLNCDGLVVSPGFIDLHTHSDYPLQAKKTNAKYAATSTGPAPQLPVTTVVTPWV